MYLPAIGGSLMHLRQKVTVTICTDNVSTQVRCVVSYVRVNGNQYNEPQITYHCLKKNNCTCLTDVNLDMFMPEMPCRKWHCQFAFL